MKKRQYICFINLILFLGSFLLLSLNGMASKETDSQEYILNKQHVSKPTTNAYITSQQLSEENETETKNDLVPAFKVLAFSFNFCAITAKPAVHFGVNLLVPKNVVPIYLSVSNFRI